MDVNAGDEDLCLPASELGTKCYWDTTYADEISSFEDTGDTGEVWFGQTVAKKVVAWICRTCGSERGVKIMDLGCGNGYTLMLLHDKNFTNLTGIDYSEHAIMLTQKIAAKKGANIRLQVKDILECEVQCEEKYDIIVDKGTFDAICLNPCISIADSRSKYIHFVEKSMKESAHFILTSCNWSKDELLIHFSGHFVLADEILSPTLTFGGKQGSRVTTLILKKKNE